MTTEPDLILLKGLRATTLADMSDTDYADLERLVAEKGIRNIDGWLGSAVRKAVDEVLKHPGHASQASHGGGRGGASGGSTGGGRSGGSWTQHDPNDKGDMKAASKELKRMTDAKSSDTGFGLTNAEKRQGLIGAKAVHDAPNFKAAREIARSYDRRGKGQPGNFDDDNRLAGAKTIFRARFPKMPDPLADDSHLPPFEKAVEPVEKHPGHGDQKVHGGGRRGGAAGSPAAAGGGGGEITRADEARMQVSQAGTQASERMVDHANEMSQTIYGGKTYIGIVDSIDSVELMGISDALTNAATSVTMLPPGRDKSFKEISNIRGTLKDADVAARSIRNKTAQRAARRAIRLSQEELTALQKVHRESWSGVGGVFGD